MVEKAADKGHFDSILRVADCYSSGHGVEKDLTTAALYIYQGAEKGDVASQYNLGIQGHKGAIDIVDGKNKIE